MMYAKQLSSLLLCFGLVAGSKAQSVYTTLALDPVYQTVPPPNDDFPQDANHVRVVSIILLATSLIFVIISFRESQRWGSTVPVVLTVGSASFVLVEAVNCYMANVYWTVSHDPSKLMFTLLGRQFDIYVGIIWWSYGAVLSCGIFGALQRNPQTGTLWALLAFSGLLDIILEEAMLTYGGIYIYYGHQPLVFNLFPCWWAFCNVSSIFVGISVTYRYRSWLEGWKSFLVPLILPLCYAGSQVLTALPTIYAIQANYHPLITQLCGVMSCTLAIVQVAVIMDTFLARDPTRLSQAGRNSQSQLAHQKLP
ncbi:hypothetical protein BKA59DRAFT_478140 [Fusarium tricinctum]|uniref:EXPERA domain-containing protein n=1 Tax=Fusarium tricinctum TaxID=61284 RepID=A0A8K0WBU7_9HYPO|nr:hypothetical protein BKA59DRAFT_478140 [Fusarium tricinctum]